MTRPDDADLVRLADAFVDPDQDRAVKRGHLRHFAGAARVLDVGCGRGAFLDLLREAGSEGVGIERSEAAAASGRERGHAVHTGDALDVLRDLASRGERFDGAFVCHLVEHLPPDGVVDLLRATAAVLRPGARLVVVTPNPRNLIVLEEVFWLDPTHLRPYPRALLAKLGALAGLQVVASLDDPATVPRRSLPRRWLARLRSALSGADRSGPMDSVVVFESSD